MAFVQLTQIAPVGDLINLRIAFTIPAQVGQSIGLRTVVPEIGRLAHVIMLVATHWG